VMPDIHLTDYHPFLEQVIHAGTGSVLEY